MRKEAGMRGGEEVDESWSAEEGTWCSLCFVHVQGVSCACMSLRVTA